MCQTNGYDPNGNLVQFTDRRGKIAKFTYDGLNRMTFAGFGWTSGTNYESTVNYSYSNVACGTLQCYTMTSTDSITGAITRTDDALNRLASETTPQGTVSYTYDNAGRRASLTVPGQSVVNYTFDNGNRLTQIAQGTTTVGFTYDNANRRATLTLPNSVVTSYSYDTASQLTGMSYALGSNPLGNLSYAYDNDGRRSSVTGSFARTGLPLAMSTTAYNANNQLTTWGTANLFYDLNGNMTSDGTHSYTWDARNRLTQMDSGNTASFSYDASGRRTSKTVLSTQTGFFYDGANAVQELSGTTVTANSLMGGIDEVFQRTDSAGARSFLTDALGSTLALTDSTGTTQTSYTLEPFGNTTTTGSATTNSFAYTGRELDATGLYYYRARYYNPTLQRFISEDPIGFEGGDLNIYGYARQDPILFSDPSGDKYCKFSNCFKVFQRMIPHFSQSDFDATANATPVFYPPTQALNSLTQQDIVGGSNTTSLNQSIPFGAGGATIQGPFGAAILLGPNAFIPSNDPDASYLHELVHAYTNMNDDQLFNLFKPNGLQHLNPGSYDITAWIMTDCTNTPNKR